MAHKLEFPSAKERFDWYESEKGRKANWNSQLQTAYDYCLPNLSNFNEKHTPGDRRNAQVWDYTAILGVTGFAGNMQQLLMPPFTKWAKLVPGSRIPDSEKESVKEQLEVINNKLFEELEHSNLTRAIDESFQEVSISTGILKIEEGDDDNPLRFTSVPLADVVIGAGPHHTLENFWRKWSGKAHMIKRLWPKAKLGKGLSAQAKDKSSSDVNLIEGTVFIENNPPGQQYLYYVQTEGGDRDLFSEWRDFSPWIGFRFSRAPGEVYGRGPALKVISAITTINKIVELSRRSADFRTNPPWLVASSSTINTENLIIDPSATIVVDPSDTLGGGLPIQTLEYGGDPKFGQLVAEDIRGIIDDVFLINPIGPETNQKMTATEVNVRVNEETKKSSSGIGRMTIEALTPIIVKSIKILQRRGDIDALEINGRTIPLKINGKDIKIEFLSPLAGIQRQLDVQNATGWMTTLSDFFGPRGLAGVNIDVFPEWLATQMNVVDKLVNKDFKNSPAVQEVKNVIKTGQAPLPPQEGPNPSVPGPIQQPIQAGAG